MSLPSLNPTRRLAPLLAVVALLLIQGGAPAQQEFKPKVGLAGKDVIWAPTPQALVDKKLDMAQVTASDFVIDLGSGDGRTVIAAAKRGARAVGIELNSDLVELSKRSAEKEGVVDKASFVKADIFAADFSQGTVITMFLLPDLNRRLRPKLLALKPGTRIVSSLFDMGDWQPDDTVKVFSYKSVFAPFLRRIKDYLPEALADDLIDYCNFYCTAYLWVVPARVAGVWQLPQGELALAQRFQMIEGTLKSGGRVTPIENGRLRGDRLSFSADGAEYSGHVSGGRIEGSVKPGAAWSATLRADNPVSSQKSQ